MKTILLYKFTVLDLLFMLVGIVLARWLSVNVFDIPVDWNREFFRDIGQFAFIICLVALTRIAFEKITAPWHML